MDFVISHMSIFLSSFIIVLLKGTQWLSKSRSPGSWAFDMFLDHHNAGGCCTVGYYMSSSRRWLSQGKSSMTSCYLKGPTMLGVITDAVKLSKNCLIVLGNETW